MRLGCRRAATEFGYAKPCPDRQAGLSERRRRFFFFFSFFFYLDSFFFFLPSLYSPLIYIGAETRQAGSHGVTTGQNTSEVGIFSHTHIHTYIHQSCTLRLPSRLANSLPLPCQLTSTQETLRTSSDPLPLSRGEGGGGGGQAGGRNVPPTWGICLAGSPIGGGWCCHDKAFIISLFTCRRAAPPCLAVGSLTIILRDHIPAGTDEFSRGSYQLTSVRVSEAAAATSSNSSNTKPSCLRRVTDWSGSYYRARLEVHKGCAS